jgi:membrane AbrB-like protein
MSTSLQVKYTEIKENWRQLIRSLVIGLVGSLIFVYLNLPLPWVIGALFTTTAACMLGQKLWIPDWLRANSHIVLGALFGTSVSPEFFGNFLSWFPSMLAVTAYVVLVMPPIMFYLVKVVRLDIVTAYFSAAPGGLIPMTALGQAMGADAKSISLIQSSRIILTVLLIPFLFTLFGGYEPSGRIGTGGSFLALSFRLCDCKAFKNSNPFIDGANDRCCSNFNDRNKLCGSTRFPRCNCTMDNRLNNRFNV